MNYGAVKVLCSYVITHLESLYLDFKLTLFKPRLKRELLLEINVFILEHNRSSREKNSITLIQRSLNPSSFKTRVFFCNQNIFNDHLTLSI